MPPRRFIRPARSSELSPADPGYVEPGDPPPIEGSDIERPVPRSIVTAIADRAIKGVERAVTTERMPMRQRGVSDFLGFGAFRGMPRAGTSIVTLAVVFLAFMGVLRGVAVIGTWFVVAAVWIGMGWFVWRNRDRIRWDRLGLLLRKPAPPDTPDAD